MTLFFAAGSAHAGKTILVFGDSLSAGYGIRSEAAWPSLLANRLKEQRLDYSVANLSISGETSAGAKSRLAAALRQHRPAVLIIELGANDGLQGLPLEQLRANLEAMIAAGKKSKARVVLIGMRLPPNYGEYARRFDALFGEVARDNKVTFTGFLLEGIGERPEFFQADMLHPTAAAQPRLLDNVWPALAPLLR